MGMLYNLYKNIIRKSADESGESSNNEEKENIPKDEEGNLLIFNNEKINSRT